jgi:N-formylglutamate amidohydrolase
VFDCHSYPSRALPYELERMSLHRPQIGIGTDAFHTPPALARALAGAFERRGYEVGLDTPFTGALVPNAFYGRDRRVRSVMMEVRKDLYMDEATGARLPGFGRIKADITAAMEEALAAGD